MCATYVRMTLLITSFVHVCTNYSFVLCILCIRMYIKCTSFLRWGYMLLAYIYVCLWMWLTLPQRNSYQGIVITDGTRSYAVFIYNCQLLNNLSFAGIGYYFSSTQQKEHRLSNTNASSTIACVNLPGSPWSTVIYRLFGKKLHLFWCRISHQVLDAMYYLNASVHL